MVSRETFLKKGQKHTVLCTGYTAEGAGVARIDGAVVFVPGLIAGEEAEIRIVNVGKSAAHGEALRVLTPSAHRVESDCPYFPACGGCDFRHMDYEEECSLKRQRVYDALTRIGGVFAGELPMHGAAETEGYRNKVQYPVARQEEKAVAGFYRARTHQVIGIETCRIQPDCADRLRAAVLGWMERFKIAAYDETSRSGYIRHIYLRKGFASGEVLCCIVANCKKLPRSKELAAAICAALPEATSIVVSYNEKAGNTILGDEFETLYGSGTIEDTLCGLRFRLSPRSFYQVNHDQAEQLYEKALELAKISSEDTVLDLYCGAGTITLCLARKAKKAFGVEIINAAIADAKENAARNGVENVEFFCADAGQAAQRFADAGQKLDVIVVDPPRKGLSADVVEAILRMAPRRVVYVSCDPATLARDVKLLCAGGYRFDRAEAFDLFPRCAHVETVALLSREMERNADA